MSDFPPPVPSLFSVSSDSLIVREKGHGRKSGAESWLCSAGFPPQGEPSGACSTVLSRPDPDMWRRFKKKRIQVTGSASLSFLCLHLCLFARPHHVQGPSVVDSLERSRTQSPPVSVHVDSGLMLTVQVFSKGRKAAAVPAYRSAGWCQTWFLSGTEAARSRERAEPELSRLSRVKLTPTAGCCGNNVQRIYNAQHRIYTL